jgi:nitrile hydratase accessory protein
MMPPTLPGRSGEPTFAEPWQAKAFATTVALSRTGLFTWPEWAAALGAEIALHPQRSSEDSEGAYYRQWLAALEGLLAARGVATTDDIGQTAEHWRRSYLHTPHGKAVLLRRDLNDMADGEQAEEHEHNHSARRRPVTVSPPR